MPSLRNVVRELVDGLVTAYNTVVADTVALQARIENRVMSRIPLAAILADLTALKSAHDTLATKLNADGGVTDTNYAAAAALTTSVTVTMTDGTTAGKIKTRADLEYVIKGKLYRKAATDDLWDLSAETDTIAAKYRAYWLYLDASGVASIVQHTGADVASAALAIAALPAIVATKCPVGVYVAGPETDFNGVTGLDSYGDYHEGLPATYTATATAITVVNP